MNRLSSKGKRKLEDQKMDRTKKLKRMWDEESDRYDAQFELTRILAITSRVANRVHKAIERERERQRERERDSDRERLREREIGN
jgi:hypothetical protein